MDSKNIKSLRKDLAKAEEQAKAERRKSARERQAKFTQKQLSAGKKRLALWLTGDDITLVTLVLAMPDDDKTKLSQYLQHMPKPQARAN